MSYLSGVDKRTSVLDYVVKNLFDRGEQHLLEVIEDLQLVDEGAKLSIVELLRDFDTVEKNQVAVSDEFQRNRKTASGDQVFNSPTAKLIVSQFHIRLERYLREFEHHLGRLRKWREVLQRKIADILEYFAEKHSNGDDSIKIFIVLQKFRNALVTCKECYEWKLQRGAQQN